MSFAVGARVWFKKAGSTPFITGDPSDAAKEVGHNPGGRLKAAISITRDPTKSLGIPGVPQIKTADLATPLTSHDGSANTFGTADPQGAIGQAQPGTPHTVTAPGYFGPPASKALFNTGNDGHGDPIDDGATDRNKKNTIVTMNPNFPSGRTAASGAAVAEGPSVSYGGHQDFVSETVDLKSSGKRLGVRVPSSELDSGVVIAVVTGVDPKSISPDGTRVRSTRMYHVNWGVSNPSKPHQAKWWNRERALLHAEEDLVSA